MSCCAAAATCSWATPGLWALADPDVLGDLLVHAGLHDVRCEPLDDTVDYDSIAHWLDLTARLAAPLRAAMAGLDEDGRAAIERGLRANAASYQQPDGRVALPERMLMASARR